MDPELVLILRTVSNTLLNHTRDTTLSPSAREVSLILADAITDGLLAVMKVRRPEDFNTEASHAAAR